MIFGGGVRDRSVPRSENVVEWERERIPLILIFAMGRRSVRVCVEVVF